jgi:hypothetical protein
MTIIGIDPGQTGYICFYKIEGVEVLFAPMPLKNDGTKEINFDVFMELLTPYRSRRACHVYLERAMPLAMGAKHAFNYGRGFAALELALHISGLPTTYVEPQKWSKVMHEGISKDLKPKAKSQIAVERLFPHLLGAMPKSAKGNYLDGAIDALLIAGWGLRQTVVQTMNTEDF